MGIKLIAVDASAEFLKAFAEVSDPSANAKSSAKNSCALFEREANKIDGATFLAQGTLYPDVIESKAPDRQKGVTIKTHHNVGAACRYDVDPGRTLALPLQRRSTRSRASSFASPKTGSGVIPSVPGLAVRILARLPVSVPMCSAKPTTFSSANSAPKGSIAPPSKPLPYYCPSKAWA
jgi:GMP synthase (glutamine-hydrolysing)